MDLQVDNGEEEITVKAWSSASQLFPPGKTTLTFSSPEDMVGGLPKPMKFRWEVQPNEERKITVQTTDDGIRFEADITNSFGRFWSCFPGDARVLTARGYRRIDAVHKGDLVVSYSANSKPVLRPVTRRICGGTRSLSRVEFSDGSTITVTGRHSVMTLAGWRRIDQLRVGEVIACPEEPDRYVQRIVLDASTAPVFTLYTAGEHNFMVEGVLAHNFTFARTLRTLWHRLFIDEPATGYAMGPRVLTSSR